MRPLVPTLASPRLTVLAALAAALLPTRAVAQDAGSPTCVVRVVSPPDGTTNLKNDLSLEFDVSTACPDPLPAPVPTLRDPNGAMMSLDFTRSGTKLTARPLGYLVDGLYEVDPQSRTAECTSNPARVTTFRVGPGPDVRKVVFTPQDKYTSGSELDSLEIFLSEPLKSGTEKDIPKYVTVSGIEPMDIWYMPDTASIVWSWKNATNGVAPTTTEKVTIRVKTGLTFAGGKALGSDIEISVRPKDFLLHGWWPGAKACSAPVDPDPGDPTDPQTLRCGAGTGNAPLGLAAFLLAPLLARLALRRGRG
ncbi:MAG: hypothetical protein QM765_23825 [Myxococcales bacterium]